MPLDEQLKRRAAWQKDEKTIIPIPIEGWLNTSGVFIRLKKKRSSDAVELDGNGNPIWIEAGTYQNGIGYLQDLNGRGYGIYLIPNAGGGADADISRFGALFYECDGVSKDEQWKKLRSLESQLGRSASSVLETRKSLHCYFKLVSGSVLPSTWTEYQQRLIQEQDSDPAIWNPARLMRLVGFDHQKWDAQQRSLVQFPVRLVQENDNIFTLDEFDQVLPEWDEERWSRAHRISERVATDPTLDPWDIRNFAHHLDGYQADGRRGWDTCKCPAHNGESDNSLHVEQSTGGYRCHSGCSSKDVYRAALDLARSRGYQLPEKREAGQRFSTFGGWLSNIKRQLSQTVQRKNAWGFTRKDIDKEKNEQSAETESNQTSKYGGSGALSNGLGDTDLHTLERSYQDVGSRPDRNKENERNRHSNGSSHTYPRSAPSGRGEGSQQYQPTNERLHSWSLSHKQDRKYIHDASGTGTGKSFDAGMATPDLFGVSRLIHVSAEHRNPTVSTLKSWSDLEARHKGLVRDEFGKLRRAKPGQPYVVSPNCSRNDTISALRSKNIGGADTSGLICQTCPNLEPCQAGAVFGFLHDRQKTLSQSRFRAHPQSLPDPSEFDYSSVVLIWDEASEIIKAHRSIDVTALDLQRAIAVLAVKLPLVFDALRPVLTALSPYLTGEIKQPYYGWKHTQIREALPFLFPVDMAAIREALTPDLDQLLNTTKDYGVDLGSLPRGLRKQFSESDAETSDRINNQLLLDWLPDFVDVLLGNVVGNLRVQNGTLTITLPDPRLGEIARSASGNIFLDATAKPEDLALALRIEPSEILTVRQEAPETSNLEIIQVATMGRLGTGSKRSEFCQKRVDALIDQIKQDTPGDVAVIDFKRHTGEGDGKRRWWVDSRALNDFEDCTAIIAVGTPCRNLSELETEFKMLYGRSPSEGTEKVKHPIQLNGELPTDIEPWFEMQVSVDVEFRNFCRRRILADIHQAIGRLRANLRPGQKLKFYFIADYPLDIRVTLKLAKDITPDAATKTERVEMAIRGAIQQLKDAGLKITQTAIATITGYSQQYISRFKVLLLLLLSDSYSKSSKNDQPPPDPGEQDWMSQKYLPLLAELPPAELLKEVLSIFEVSGQMVFKSIWDAVPSAAQIKILQALMFTLSPGELRSLALASGAKI
jgi:hypothetical protein